MTEQTDGDVAALTAPPADDVNGFAGEHSGDEAGDTGNDAGPEVDAPGQQPETPPEQPKPKSSRKKPALPPSPGNDGVPRVIQAQAKLLKGAVAAIADVVERRNTIPILSNLRLTAQRGRAELVGTDLDLQCVRLIDVEQEADAPPIAITVCAETLKSILAKIDAEAMVQLEQVDGRMLVTAGRSKFTLPTLPFEDFPVILEAEGAHRFEIGAFGLAAMIAGVRFAMSTEETRYYLNGIYLHAAETTGALDGSGGGDGEGTLLVLRAAATDGHRLARFDLPQPDGAGALDGVILPRKAVGVIDKMIDGLPEGAVIEVEIGAAKARFDFGEAVLITKLVDGTFPDYTRVIPTANDKVVLADPRALIAAIARVSVMAGGKQRLLRVDLERDVATLSCVSAEIGDAREEVPCEYDGYPLTIGFNAQYLTDTLGRVAGDTMRWELADPAAPTLIRDANPEACGLYVVMPMRV